MLSSPLSLIPFVFFILWLSVIVYAVILATRLVKAVEQIARTMALRSPGPQEPPFP